MLKNGRNGRWTCIYVALFWSEYSKCLLTLAPFTHSHTDHRGCHVTKANLRTIEELKNIILLSLYTCTVKWWISCSAIFLCSAICHSHTDGTGQFNTQPEPVNKPLIRRLEDGPLYPLSHRCERHRLNILNKASISPLPHILMDLDHHTLGSAGSLLSSVSLFPYICISVKSGASSSWCLFCC